MSVNRSITMTPADPTTVLPLSERPVPRRRRSFPTVAALAAAVVGACVIAFTTFGGDDTGTVRSERLDLVPTTVTASDEPGSPSTCPGRKAAPRDDGSRITVETGLAGCRSGSPRQLDLG